MKTWDIQFDMFNNVYLISRFFINKSGDIQVKYWRVDRHEIERTEVYESRQPEAVEALRTIFNIKPPLWKKLMCWARLCQAEFKNDLKRGKYEISSRSN